MSTVPFIKIKPKSEDPVDLGAISVLLVAPKRGKDQLSKKVGRDHQRMRDIRQSLDMTQPQFADKLGMLTPTLIAIEHGRTATVKPEYLDRAEALLVLDQDKWALSAKYKGVPMKKLLEEWANRLQVKQDDLPTLAALIGVSISTISRWRNELARPTPTDIITYEKTVEITASRLAKANRVINTKLVAVNQDGTPFGKSKTKPVRKSSVITPRSKSGKQAVAISR